VRPASLLVVFVAAKAAALAGHHVPLSWWTPIAYFWQDLLVVLVFTASDAWLGRRERIAWGVYGVLVAYAVLNIPVVRTLSTPLTAAMWRAARGPLFDSIWLYATWRNVLVSVAVSVLACLAPLCFRRVSRLRIAALLAAGALFGPAAMQRVDTLGLERNAWTALLVSLAPHREVTIAASAADADLSASGFDRTPSDEFPAGGLRAIAAGRNIVLVSLESTAAAYLGIYGATPDAMPHLSELARTAIVFDSAYAVYPESIKGLHSVLCSTYPSLDSPVEAYAARPCQSLAATLAGSGYATALFHSGRFMYLGMDAVVRDRGFDTLADAGDIGGHHQSSFGVDEPSTVDRILRWVDGVAADRPFFVTYLPIAGHHPYETPERGPYAEDQEFGRYRNALHYGDAALGALMRGLDVRGRRQNTVWIVLGDHGEAFGQHEGNYGHTFHVYDENVRVPFLISAPGLFPRQIRSRRVVSLIDTAPTVLEMAGIQAPENYQGHSMLGGGPRMAFFFADYSRPMLGLRDGRMKFIYELDSGRSRMFDLEKDPGERSNVADRNPERGREYETLLRRWKAAQAHPRN
jgi:arylsulfatase A-like enzyme